MQTEPSAPEIFSGRKEPIQSIDRPAFTFRAASSFLVIAALLIFLYYMIGIKLVVDWYNIADYSHGFLVPLFSRFLLWDKRKQIAAMPVRPTWAGLPLVIFGLIFLI